MVLSGLGGMLSLNSASCIYNLRVGVPLTDSEMKLDHM